MSDRLEAYVDGELTGKERQAFEAELWADPAWRVEVERARRVRDELRCLPQPICPPEVTAAVMAEVRQQARYERQQQWAVWLGRLLASARGLVRPVLVMTAFVVLIVAAAHLSAPPGPSVAQQQGYTQAEVEQAVAQVRWTLGYLAEVGETTGEAVQQEALREHITVPMQHALDEVRM